MTKRDLLWFAVVVGVFLLGLLRRGMKPPEDRLYIPQDVLLGAASTALGLFALLMFAMSAAFAAVVITSK